jgi:hypothetical protein
LQKAAYAKSKMRDRPDAKEDGPQNSGPVRTKMFTIIISVVTSLTAMALINWYMVKRVNDAGGCPECHTPAPHYRKAANWRQALWGGWTCENCGSELDRHGRILVEGS